MCKRAPGRRCSGHVLENVDNLEIKINKLEESIATKSRIIAKRRHEDSSFDETDEGQLMIKSLDEDYKKVADERERLHQEKAALYLTEAGKKHLQEIIEDPNSSAKEILDAQIHHQTALTREEKDKEVMKIVKDEDLDVIDKEEMLTVKIGAVDKEISSIRDRLKYINETYETVQKKIERFRIRGEHEKVKEWSQVNRKLAEEGRYLTSYKRQLESHKTNVQRYLNRKEREEEIAAREELKAQREQQIAKDQRREQKRQKRQMRIQKFDRFLDNLVRKVIMDWM